LIIPGCDVSISLRLQVGHYLLMFCCPTIQFLLRLEGILLLETLLETLQLLVSVCDK